MRGVKTIERQQVVPPAHAKASNNPLVEYQRLLRELGSTPRYQSAKVSFLEFSIDVPDCASFLAQLKELFVEELYLFETDQNKPLIIDCGANIGMSCLFFKQVHPSCRIKAFEADPAIWRTLSSNLSSNGITDVEVIQKAVWVDDLGVSFASDGADGGSILGQAGKVQVPSVRLQTVLASHEAVDLLKIDIEGAEYAVLKDSESQLSRVRNIFVEYHSWNGQEQHLSGLLEILRRSGFRYHITHITPHKSPFVNRGAADNMDLQLNIFAYRSS